MKPEIQKVLFRASRAKVPEITAVLIGQPGSHTAPLCVWDSLCGHGSGSWCWYQSTRPAKPAEYADALKKLQGQYTPEYTIKVVKKYSAKDRNALNKALAN